MLKRRKGMLDSACTCNSRVQLISICIRAVGIFVITGFEKGAILGCVWFSQNLPCLAKT